jgi:hypothetical protein
MLDAIDPLISKSLDLSPVEQSEITAAPPNSNSRPWHTLAEPDIFKDRSNRALVRSRMRPERSMLSMEAY